MSCRLIGVGAGDGTADDGHVWQQLGFTVTDRTVPVGNGALLLGREGLVIDGLPSTPEVVDGIPISTGSTVPPAVHANGAFELDHLVWFTNSIERTSAAIEAQLGLRCRRVRETTDVRQAFHRFDDEPSARGCILELAETDRVRRSALMGVVFNVTDLDGLCGALGPDLVSPPRTAVQSGRRIATVRKGAGLPTAVALMTPADR